MSVPALPPWLGTGPRDASERLEWLARQIRALSPDWQRPERFFERRDDLAAEARRVAADLTAVARSR